MSHDGIYLVNNWKSNLIIYLAADESLSMAIIFPFLVVNPTFPSLSFSNVIVLPNGLNEKIFYLTPDDFYMAYITLYIILSNSI